MVLRMRRLRLSGLKTSAAALALLALCLYGPAEARAQWATSGNNISNTNTGNVGVGTASPAAKLDVAETSTSPNRGIISTQYSNDALGNRLFLRKARGASGTAPAAVQLADTLGLILFSGFDGSAFVDGSRVSAGATQTWTTSARGSSLSFSVTPNNSTTMSIAMVIDQSSNVGVGTGAPGYKLDVAGQVRSSSGGFVFPDGTTQATAASGTVTGVAAGNGLTGGGPAGSLTLNVGAGTGLTVAPDSISVNYGSTAGTAVEGSTALTVTAGSGMSGGGTVTLGAGGSVTLTNNDKGSAQNIFKNVASAAGVTQFSASSNNDSITFEGAGGTSVSFNAAAKKVTISSTATAPSGWTDGGASVTTTNAAARVGIGTATPTHTLEVAGTINATGAITGATIEARWQDVAEWVPSAQKLSAGTVVVLDPERNNQVLASATSYDTSVAGVISAQPGIALGERGEGKVLVATTGRVKVKADATRAPIKIGDLLVTSDVAGVAMKSEPMTMNGRKFHSPGTIIGKALEPLAGGVGEILVLLSLQ